MKIAGYILVGLFVLMSIVHLVFCYKENEKGRRISKPFCLLFLGIGIALLIPSQPLIYIAVFMGMLGDILLIWKRDFRFFIMGAIAFVAGHFLYYAELITILYKVIPFYVFIILGVIPFIAIFALYPWSGKKFGKKAFFGNFYFTVQLINIICCIMLICVAAPKVWPGICATIGYLLFITSDSILVITNFLKDVKRRDFYIMITYLAAELTICLGFILLFI